jgi:hypothetical protein
MKQHSSGLICVISRARAINAALRLAQAHEAGADEQAEDFPQAILLDAIQVQLARLVVDRAHEVLAGSGECAREGENFRHGCDKENM